MLLSWPASWAYVIILSYPRRSSTLDSTYRLICPPSVNCDRHIFINQIAVFTSNWLAVTFMTLPSMSLLPPFLHAYCHCTQCQRLTGFTHFYILYCAPLIGPSFFLDWFVFRLPIYPYHALPCLCLLMDSKKGLSIPFASLTMPWMSRMIREWPQLVCGATLSECWDWDRDGSPRDGKDGMSGPAGPGSGVVLSRRDCD